MAVNRAPFCLLRLSDNGPFGKLQRRSKAAGAKIVANKSMPVDNVSYRKYANQILGTNVENWVKIKKES
jgi:hypothetical protein